MTIFTSAPVPLVRAKQRSGRPLQAGGKASYASAFAPSPRATDPPKEREGRPQDSVDRQATRTDGRLDDLTRQLQPSELARTLGEDARKCGL